MRTFFLLGIILTAFLLLPPAVAQSVDETKPIIPVAPEDRETINIGTCLISPPYEFVGEKGAYSGGLRPAAQGNHGWIVQAYSLHG